MNGESFTGAFKTCEEAKAEGHAIALECGRDSFWVGESASPPPPEHSWYADEWLEYLSEWTEDEDWDKSTKEQREELESEVRALMSKWLDKYDLRPKFFVVENVVQIKQSRD